MAAAVLAAAFLCLLLPLPPRPRALAAGTHAGPTAVGSFHIHTNRSDGSGSPDDVANAAARAGLQFIVLTDHGDGTRRPDPPQFRAGVLVIDAVELSTQSGHYIALDLPPAPYPLRGEARDVVDDVKRLGGFGVVAHPDSAKPELRWRDWQLPFDGIEWLNADTEWRDETTPGLVRAVLRYPFRPTATLSSLLDRPDRTLTRWDVLTQSRRVAAFAGADAHARAGWNDDDMDGYRRDWFLRLPSYETSFRTFAMRVVLDRPLDRDGTTAGAQVISALRAGRVYTAVDGVGTPAALDFTLNGATLRARANADGGDILIRRDGRIVAHTSLPEVTFDTKGEWGTYRAEAYLSRQSQTPGIPWIVSNPIYVRPDGWGEPVLHAPPPATASRRIEGGPWHVEKDDRSAATVAQGDNQTGAVEFTYRLADGERSGQYAALGISVGTGLTGAARLAFRGSASRPMRISVQAREPRSGNRWQRSVYLDTTVRDIIVPFSDMLPLGTTAPLDAGITDIVLFVVDTTNTLPGTSGVITIADVRVER